VTCRPSFEEIKGLADKVKNSKKRSGVGQHGYSVMIIGNKDDLSDKRNVPTLEGRDLAKELGCGFLEVSAKSGKHVNKAFEAIARSLCGEPTPCSAKVTREKVDGVVVPREGRRRISLFRRRIETVFCLGFKRRQT